MPHSASSSQETNLTAIRHALDHAGVPSIVKAQHDQIKNRELHFVTLPAAELVFADGRYTGTREPDLSEQERFELLLTDLGIKFRKNLTGRRFKQERADSKEMPNINTACHTVELDSGITTANYKQVFYFDLQGYYVGHGMQSYG